MKIEDKGALLHTIVQVKRGYNEGAGCETCSLNGDRGQMWYHVLDPMPNMGQNTGYCAASWFMQRVSLKAGLI